MEIMGDCESWQVVGISRKKKVTQCVGETTPTPAYLLQ